MTTASAPAMSSERFQNRKNRIASLSSKNEEFLDQINKLQHSHSQALSVLNNQLETIPTDDSEQNIDNLVNNLKFNQRRNNNLPAALRSGNGKNLEDVMEVEDDYKMNETGTITAVDDSLSSRKSAKLAMVNRTVKELKKIESNGELDRKYFSAENNSDSEDVNENSSIEDNKDFENTNDRRRIHKGHLTLTINTKTTKSSSRLITPESSDSEFDISKSHMPLAPTLGGSRNSLRVVRHSSAEHYNGNLSERRGRGIFSMDDVIEEERGGSLSDVAEQSEIGTENINRMRGKQIISANGRKRTQKYMDENDVPKTIKVHRRPQTDDSYDIPDDNSSVMSTDSYLQIEELRARIQKLESERIDDEIMSERKSQRRKKHHSDSISPAALSPDSSQGGTSSTTGVPRRSLALAQHQKHLQNAFDMFEKAFTTDYPVDDSSPPPSHSMAMVVSSALSLNQKLRSIMTQMELDGQLSERGMKALLKTSDEQVRSLTECLLALAPLAPKRVSTKKMERDHLGIKGYAYYPGDSLQMPASSQSTRSISPPIPRISSAPVIAPHESQISEHDQLHDQSSRRVSPVPLSDQSSPPNSYYAPQRATSRYRSSSPILQPEYNESQISSTRVLERKTRRSSGTAYPSINPSPSPPPMQHPPTHYDQSGSRVYYSEIPREAPRELPRLQRYSIQGYSNISPQPASSAYQRTASRPSSHIRTDELSHPSNHHARTSSTSSTSSIHRSSSGRSYTSRVTNEEYVSSPASATRSQPRYEYTRRYPSDGQSPIDRRPTPGMEMDRRYSRRMVNQIYEPEDGYDGSNGYGENISERDYVRDDKMGIRRNISNGSSTFRQKMVPAQEQEVISNVGVGNEESRSDQQNDEINDQNVQVNGTNVENSEENDGYI
ncbi:hypothetical protein RclHR1_23280001 [Rhizophagus clarus]|uniref:Uncharacterized protein n=1 Tax=Rhizophagus clarus TaxID=94130 RepID=A0A2Z6R983_9GLOM|nr:hypothetical protein RclHR1_23280001 [Rhizophagus clarus]GES75439.1 hypothetical protein GLOIN_2v1668378 [Rhizophagus clarus]